VSIPLDAHIRGDEAVRDAARDMEDDIADDRPARPSWSRLLEDGRNASAAELM
jgi:hypothetical protein